MDRNGQHTRANTPNFQLWGNKTLQRTPTMLDRVGMRRLLFYIEKNLRQLFNNHLHSGEADGWLDFEIFKFLDDIQNRKEFCDYEFASNEKGVMLGILPTQTVPWIWIILEIGK